MRDLLCDSGGGLGIEIPFVGAACVRAGDTGVHEGDGDLWQAVGFLVGAEIGDHLGEIAFGDDANGRGRYRGETFRGARSVVRWTWCVIGDLILLRRVAFVAGVWHWALWRRAWDGHRAESWFGQIRMERRDVVQAENREHDTRERSGNLGSRGVQKYGGAIRRILFESRIECC